MFTEGSPPATCHKSCVRCQVSHITCQVSHVTCNFFFSFHKLVKLVGGGSFINKVTPSSIYISSDQYTMCFRLHLGRIGRGVAV